MWPSVCFKEDCARRKRQEDDDEEEEEGSGKCVCVCVLIMLVRQITPGLQNYYIISYKMC